MSMTRMLFAAAIVVVGGVASAQESANSDFSTTPPMREATFAKELATELRRASVLELRAIETPAGDDYAVTGFLLDLAGACTDETAEDLRLRVEAAFNAGDSVALESAGRKLLRVDPTDTRTQLRLLSSRIASIQTIEGRLEAIDRLLGSQGAKLDPSVRSRLALDGALLAKEQGDTAGYVARLKTAAQLDVTNKEAALLAYEHFVSVNDDAAGAAELLVNLLYADPLDAAVHALIRDSLLSVRAIPEAQRFQNSRLNIVKRLNFSSDERDTAEELLFKWLTKGPEAALVELEGQLRLTRDEESRRQSMLDPAARAQERRPEDNRLSLGFEELRVLSAVAAGNRTSIEASIRDLEASLAEQAAQVQSQSDGLVGAQVAAEDLAADMMRMQVLRLVSGADADRVADDLAKFETMKDVKPVQIALVKAWQAFRSGDHAVCADELSKAESSSFGALLAAELAAAKGDTLKACALFEDVYRESALSALGVYSLSRMIAIDPAKARLDESGKRVTAIVSTVPQWFDSMAMDPRLHQVVQIKPRKETILATEQAIFDVTLKNVSRIALGLGSASPLNSRLMFGPTLETKLGPLYSAEPEVTDIAGRFRLMPGEEVRFAVEPERGVTGHLAGSWCRFPVRLRWRVIQGYEPGRGQSRVPGPGCVDLMTETIVKQGLGEASSTDEDLARLIAEVPESRLQAVLYAARSSFAGLTATELNAANPQGVANSLATRYPSLSPAGRAMVLCLIPPTSRVAELAVLDTAVAQETDQSLAALAMILRANVAEHALIQKCEASDRADVRNIARIVKSRLIAGRAVYATRGVDAALVNPEAPR